MVVEMEEHLSKIKWIKSEKIVRASIVVARREDQSELKAVVIDCSASQVEVRGAH